MSTYQNNEAQIEDSLIYKTDLPVKWGFDFQATINIGDKTIQRQVLNPKYGL